MDSLLGELELEVLLTLTFYARVFPQEFPPAVYYVYGLFRKKSWKNPTRTLAITYLTINSNNNKATHTSILDADPLLYVNNAQCNSLV